MIYEKGSSGIRFGSGVVHMDFGNFVRPCIVSIYN